MRRRSLWPPSVLGRRLIRQVGASRSGSSRPLLILYYNPDWISVPEEGPLCDGRCDLTLDRARFNEADVVVFHIPTLSPELRLEKMPGQRWVASSMESEVNYPRLRNADFMRWFDYTMTYRLDSDIPMPYFNVALAHELLTPPQPKTEVAPAVYIASSLVDRSKRMGYVQELMRDIAVDSYGRSLQNRTFAEDRGRETKLETIARYRFTLAFENSIARDYVTEKFFDPLIAGSVPVYLGAPNVADFAVGEHCFINSADFAGPRELADELQRLTRDERAYQEFLAWKTRPLNDRFLRLVDQTRGRSLCRLCEALNR